MSERASHEDPEQVSHPRAEDCPVGECEVCAVRDCPLDEPLHYHHDGCPACWAEEQDVRCGFEDPPASAPPDVLGPFLEGARLVDIGSPPCGEPVLDREQRLREQLRELQQAQRVMLAHVEALQDLIQQANGLVGKLGHDAENAGRACFEVYEHDDLLRGYLAGIGMGWMRTSQILAFVANVLLVKTKRLESETGEGT